MGGKVFELKPETALAGILSTETYDERIKILKNVMDGARWEGAVGDAGQRLRRLDEFARASLTAVIADIQPIALSRGAPAEQIDAAQVLHANVVADAAYRVADAMEKERTRRIDQMGENSSG